VLEEQENRADGVIRYQNAELVFFVNSGFGDGTFPVYELVSAGGRWGVEVVFIEPGTPYPFTPERMRENNERVWERIRSYSKESGAESNPAEQ